MAEIATGEFGCNLTDLQSNDRSRTRGEAMTDGERLLHARIDELEARLLKWETALTAVMPPDFKDWHQNAKAEWPEIAASTLTNLRERLEEANAWAERLEAQLKAESDAHESWQNEHLKVDGEQCRQIRELEAQVAAQSMQLAHDAVTIEYLNGKVSMLTLDAERGKFMIDNGGWHRGEEQTHLAVLVPQGSDLSCLAMRRAAIDKAINAQKGTP